VSPLSEVSLITWREARKTFRSARGVALAVISALAGGAVSMLFAWFDRMGRERLPPDTDLHEIRDRFFTTWYRQAGLGHHLADCPYALWMMLVANLWLAPLLVALMTFDAVSGDLQRGTVRFWVVRARRSSCLLGKALGAWMAVLAVSLGMNVIVWATTAWIEHLGALYVLGWGLRFFAVVVPVTGAWCAIAVLVGSQVKTPMLSLLTIFATFFAIWVVHIAALVRQQDWLSWAYPSGYDVLFLSADPGDLGRGLLGTGLIVALSVAGAIALFDRRDL
jgi:ABC-type transport system involved in multi-copper enzyme maturation permease subunit